LTIAPTRVLFWKGPHRFSTSTGALAEPVVHFSSATQPAIVKKTPLILLVLVSFGLAAAAAHADVKATIASIEKLPRGKRLAAYEQALADKRLAQRDRTELIHAFAGHAAVLSPLYGKGKFPFNTQTWIALLREGFNTDPRDARIACALAGLYIDRSDYRAALPVVKALRDAHPGDYYAAPWLAWCESQQASAAHGIPGGVHVIPIHFCVLTRNPQAHRVATPTQCHKECDILNGCFRTLDGKLLVRFEFKGCAGYQEIGNARNPLLAFGDSTKGYGGFTDAFNTCKDHRLRDPRAVNFYIIDRWSLQEGFKDSTSSGARNSNRPFVLIDWQRLNKTGQNAEGHEMGHAFGLVHVGVPDAKRNSSTNIMTSCGEQFGNGGQRDLGFTPTQAAMILYHAKHIHDRFQAPR
jgi:hypothetical protein